MLRMFALLVMVVLLPGAARETDLQRLKGKHYILRHDTLPEVARELSRHVDAIHEEYTKRFSTFGVRNARPMTVWVFANNADYLAFMSGHGFDANNTGGVFFVSDDAQGIATYLEGQSERRVTSILQHEGFHLFAFLRIHKDLPVWANEGLAEFFGAGILVKNRMVTGIAPAVPLLRVQRAIREEAFIPLRELLTMSDAEWDRRTVGGDPLVALMYDQSWSICQFLIVGDNGKHVSLLMDYLEAIRRGRSPDLAMREAFGDDGLASFEAAWKKYILEAKPDPLLDAVDRLEFLGRGLLALHQTQVPVRSFEELRTRLTQARFSSVVYTHGVMQRFQSDDPKMFEPPPAQKQGAVSKFELADPPSEGLPPEIVLTGLRVTVRITWALDEHGEVIQRVEFE